MKRFNTFLATIELGQFLSGQHAPSYKPKREWSAELPDFDVVRIQAYLNPMI